MFSISEVTIFAEEIAETLEEAGYRCAYTLLNAVHYGVPQMRERMFLIGLAGELNAEPLFLRPPITSHCPAATKGPGQWH